MALRAASVGFCAAMSVKTVDVLSKIATIRVYHFLCHLELVELTVWFEAVALDWCSKDFLASQAVLGALGSLSRQRKKQAFIVYIVCLTCNLFYISI